MNPQLAILYASLKTATDALLEEVSSLSGKVYHFKPAPEKWSVSQILTHLLTSERLSLNYMKKKSQARVETLTNAGWMEDVRFSILQLSQILPLRYEAPRVVVENTPAPMSFEDLVRDWEGLRTEMFVFFESINPQMVHKQIYRHPYAGRLNAIHAVRFMVLHLLHHRPQIISITRANRGGR